VISPSNPPGTGAQLYAFFLGACIGSFLNVCVVRWPRERSIIRPRSRCTRCGNQLAWFENVPVLSWIALRGRCRCCDERISPLYPAVELLVALIWVMTVRHFGVTLMALRVAVFATILLGVALTDLRDYLIPDGFTLSGLTFALVTSVIAYAQGDQALFATPYDALIGACAGAGLVAIVGWLGEIATRREAMGLGDVTLMAFVGAAVGPSKALMTVFIGAALGAVIFLVVVAPIAWIRRGRVREQTELALGGSTVKGFEIPLVPFGVFLAPAGLATLLWGDSLISWIVRP
jgi:leader peptidase (prepilin peptidase)/N-methyltransferase